MFELALLFLFIYFLIRLIQPKGSLGESRVKGKIESLISKNDEFQSFSDVILKAADGTTQIDHILISPYGIFVIETKNFKGWIFGEANQKKWTQSLRRRYRFHNLFYKYTFQFQNPLHQNYKHVKAVQSFLGVDQKYIFNVVVFVGNSKFMTPMPSNVLGLDSFLSYIESHTERILNAETVKEFGKRLNDYVNAASFKKDDHIRSVENNIKNPICPRCGKAMVLRIARKGAGTSSKFWGCSNFPSCKVTREFRQFQGHAM